MYQLTNFSLNSALLLSSPAGMRYLPFKEGLEQEKRYFRVMFVTGSDQSSALLHHGNVITACEVVWLWSCGVEPGLYKFSHFCNILISSSINHCNSVGTW